MIGPASSFSHLMHRVAEGDQNAFAQLFHLYNPTLLTQLRSRLKKLRYLRSLLDPDDLAQEIWTNFAAGSLRRRQFVTPDAFLRYLARTACNHILKIVRDHLGARKRDPRRCHFLSEAGTGAAAAVVADPSPTPAWTAEIQDEFERRLALLTVAQQRAARMAEAGFSHVEIAGKFGCSARTIERMMEKIRQSLESHSSDPV